MKYSTMKRLADVRQVFRTVEQAFNAFLKIALCCILLLGMLVWGFILGKDFERARSTPMTEASFTPGEQTTISDYTTLGAMQIGESCLIPDSIFREWPNDADGNPDAPDDAILLVYKNTSDVTGELYLPLDTPVVCTAQAPLLGRPYIHRVKGPNDRKSWFQIRGAEQIMHYTMNCWDSIPADKRRRLVEVNVH